jgi:hypothetical protein
MTQTKIRGHEQDIYTSRAKQCSLAVNSTKRDPIMLFAIRVGLQLRISDSSKRVANLRKVSDPFARCTLVAYGCRASSLQSKFKDTLITLVATRAYHLSTVDHNEDMFPMFYDGNKRITP